MAPITVTIEQVSDGRFRATYLPPPVAEAEGTGAESIRPRTLESDTFTGLMADVAQELAPIVAVLDSSVVLTTGRDEDEEDLADARAAMEAVRRDGGIPWEQVEAELGS